MYEHEAYDRERSISAAHASARQDERREIETTGEGGQKLHDRFREVFCNAATCLIRPNIFGPQVTALDRFHCTCTYANESMHVPSTTAFQKVPKCPLCLTAEITSGHTL